MSFKTLLASACVVSTVALPVYANDVHQGDVVAVTLSELHPTQPAVGYDQIMYKLGRFQFDREKLFDEIYEANGQKGVTSFSENAHPNIPSTFQCDEKIGANKKDMKTIVVAPNGEYYLTDGHHTFNAFYQMAEGGADFRVNVVVDKDYSDLKDMSQFWQAMEKDGNVWLYGAKGEAIVTDQLPKQLGIHNFANDRYRGLMYFSRDVGWNKPKQPVPFLEFYWTRELRKKVDLDNFDLNSMDGYAEAIKATSKAILSINTSNVGESNLSVKEMGQFSEFKQKGLDKLLKKGGKVDYMLRYKTSASGNGLSYDLSVKHAPTLKMLDTTTLAANMSYNDYPAVSQDGDINAIVEIPAGTSAKWELSKVHDNQIIWEYKKNKPRIVNYLGYPANYGSIPRTALPKEFGGDGDPIDVIILGQSVPRGEVVPVRLIAVMKMIDDGEQDDKLIGVLTNESPFSGVTSLQQLNADYPNVTDLLATWFSSYKGADGGIEISGWGDEKAAQAILKAAQEHF